MSYVGVDIGGTKILVTTEDATGVHTVSASVGIPGVVLPNGRCWAPNATAINNVDLTAEVQRRWGVLAIVANDAKMALLAETAETPVSQASPVVLIAVGTGIGGAIKIGDSILDGHRGTAGSFGWLRINTDAGWKPWEDVASGRALDEAARDLGLANGPALMMMA